MAANHIRTMVKKVNVYAPLPIRTVTPMIYGRLDGVAMSPANILKCLIGRATVHEVLSDGSLLKLTEKNYNTINKPIIKKEAKPQTMEKEVSKSAIMDTDVKHNKRMILKDEVALTDTLKKVEKPIETVPIEEAKPEEIIMDVKPDLVFEEIDNEVIVEAKEAENESDEEAELAEIEAEIAKLEAEEAAAKAEHEQAVTE